MGGYGGALGRVKEKCYYDTGGHKVKDKNAIEVAEHYMSEGKEVAFLQEKQNEKRPDLLVESRDPSNFGIMEKFMFWIRRQMKWHH